MKQLYISTLALCIITNIFSMERIETKTDTLHGLPLLLGYYSTFSNDNTHEARFQTDGKLTIWHVSACTQDLIITYPSWNETFSVQFGKKNKIITVMSRNHLDVWKRKTALIMRAPRTHLNNLATTNHNTIASILMASSHTHEKIVHVVTP